MRFKLIVLTVTRESLGGTFSQLFWDFLEHVIQNLLGRILRGFAWHRKFGHRQRRRIKLAGYVTVVQVLGDRFARHTLPIFNKKSDHIENTCN